MVPRFSKEHLQRLFVLLNEQLKSAGVTGEICIVGGAAMILAFGSRESTEDIDALLIAPSSVRAAIKQIATDEDLPANWLNDGAKGFASSQATEMVELMQFSHLRVVSPPPEYILAMKCVAARTGLEETDKEDAKFLIQRLQLTDPSAVLQVVEKYYPKSRIPAKTAYFIEEICHELD